MDENNQYLNNIRSHLVTIVPMAPFTPKLSSKLRSALHFRIFDKHPTLHSSRQYCSILLTTIGTVFITRLTTSTLIIVTICCAQ